MRYFVYLHEVSFNDIAMFFKKIYFKNLLFGLFISISIHTYSQDTIFFEKFDYSGSALPSGWTNEIISPFGVGYWKMGVGAGTSAQGVAPIPDTTAMGQQNVFFWHSNSDPEQTDLITPYINTEFVVKPQLSFYHAQVPKAGNFNTLRVFARGSPGAPWQSIHNYLTATDGWVERIIDLDIQSDSLQIAFRATQGNYINNSVCVDAVLIIETDSLERELTNLNTIQASTSFIPAGTNNNEILRIQFRVMGNFGELELESFSVNSLNTDDNIIKPDGVKLYFTQSEVFSTDSLLGQGVFSSGEIVFDNLEFMLPTGYSYVWVTYDIEEIVHFGNVADAYIPAGGIIVSGESYPDVDHNPLGHRVILQTILYDAFDYDDYEAESDWVLTGEWEIDIPTGKGGSLGGPTEGNPGANTAVVGTKVLGTDLTGLNDYPGNYEQDLDSFDYQAISPEMNCKFFNNISLSFYQWLNVFISYDATIDISTDGGESWSNVWDGSAGDAMWVYKTFNLQKANRQENVKLRFTIGNTGNSNLQSGWNIDELIVTGSYITRDVGVTDWLEPQSACGMTNQEDVTVMIENFGAENISGNIPIAFSLDGGQVWERDTIWSVNILPGDSMQYTFIPKADFSEPGRYNSVIAKTILPDDQDADNDAFYHQVFSIPVYFSPYSEAFGNDEAPDDGFWTGYGDNKSIELASPSGSILNAAYSGNFAWITNPVGPYNPDELSWVESPCFNFSDIDAPVLEFSIVTNTQNDLDGAAIDYSLDEGESWVRVEPQSMDLAWNWHNGVNVAALQNATGNGAGWSGNTNGWKRVRLVLPESLSGENQVKFRFLFASQNIIPVDDEEGVAFDAVEFYETPFDVGVTELIYPLTSCELSDEELISLNVKNFGIRTLPAGTIIPAGIDINENEPVIEEFVLIDDLEPDNDVELTFNASFDLSEPGDYIFTAYTMMPGDYDFFNPGVFNDSLITSIEVYGLPEVSIWHADTIYTTQPDTLVFDPGPDYVDYLWQDNSTNQTYTVTSPSTQTYSVIVSDDNACQNSASVVVYTRDIEISELISPSNQCDFFEEIPVVLEISNIGVDPFEAGYELPVRMSIDSNLHEEKIFVLDNELNPGESVALEFDAEVGMFEFGDYQFLFELLINDAEPLNNIAAFSVISYGYPFIDLGGDIYSLQPDSIQIDAGAGMANYEWQDGYDGQIYLVTSDLTQTYSVTITDEFGCSSFDEISVNTYDIEVSSIESPVDDCELSDQEFVSIRILNTGLDVYVATELNFYINIEGANVFSESVVMDNDLNIGEYIDVEFSNPIDMTELTDYSFEIIVANIDADMQNNQLNAIVTTHGYPEPSLPLYIVTDTPEDVILEPGDNFASYLWNDGSTASTLDINDWGEYWVTVTNDFGCEGTDSTTVVPEVYDPALSDIIEPQDYCFDDIDLLPVTIMLYNEGPAPMQQGAEINMYYALEDDAEVIENYTLESDFLPNTYLYYTFQEEIFIENPALYNIEAWIEFVNDDDLSNNFYNKNFDIFPRPETALPDTIFSDEPLDLVIDAGEGFLSYLWHDGWDERFYPVEEGESQWYFVSVVDANGCYNTDSVFVLTYDWEIIDILSPESNCTLSVNEPVVFSLKNNGYDFFVRGFEYNVGLYLDDDEILIQTFRMIEDFYPNDVISVEFEQFLDLSETGDYNIAVWLDFIDTNPDNNYLEVEVEVSGLPFVDLGPDIETSVPDTIVLDAGTGFYSYLWHDGYTGQVYNVQDFGLHWVEVDDIYNCNTRDTISIIPVTFINDMLASNIRVYPNPANDHLFIDFSDAKKEVLEIQIINMIGKLEKKIKLNVFEDKVVVNVSDLDEGAYLIKIICKDNVATYKFTRLAR